MPTTSTQIMSLNYGHAEHVDWVFGNLSDTWSSTWCKHVGKLRLLCSCGTNIKFRAAQAESLKSADGPVCSICQKTRSTAPGLESCFVVVK